jgi:hypothetical protein
MNRKIVFPEPLWATEIDGIAGEASAVDAIQMSRQWSREKVTSCD